jgi:hypothetical protein
VPGEAPALTLSGFAGAIDQRCATLLAQLGDVARSSAAVAGVYARVSAELDAVMALAAEAGDVDLVAPARAAAAQLERLDLPDPLTAAPGGVVSPATGARVAQLRERIAQAGRDVAETVGTREKFPARRAELASRIEAVATAEAELADLYARVRERIVDPSLAPAPCSAAILRARLAEIDDLIASSAAPQTHAFAAGLASLTPPSLQWRRLAAALSTVADQVNAACDQVERLRGIAAGLLERRDELRGRLSAYRAKAVARGHAEQDALTAMYETAYQLLYTAPCDLRAATRAVHAYVGALAQPADGPSDPGVRSTHE